MTRRDSSAYSLETYFFSRWALSPEACFACVEAGIAALPEILGHGISDPGYNLICPRPRDLLRTVRN